MQTHCEEHGDEWEASCMECHSALQSRAAKVEQLEEALWSFLESELSNSGTWYFCGRCNGRATQSGYTGECKRTVVHGSKCVFKVFNP